MRNYQQTMAMLITIAILSIVEAIIILPHSLVGSIMFVGLATLMIVLAVGEYRKPKNKAIRLLKKLHKCNKGKQIICSDDDL